MNQGNDRAMEFEAFTSFGMRVRLTIDRDSHSIHQIYAHFTPAGETAEWKCLCNGWGRRKTPEGITEGVIIPGQVLEISRADWLKVFYEREDLRDREDLQNIRLVKVYCSGDRFTIDAYTLSARVDRATWEKIASYMHEVDGSENESIHAGDHFVGWVINEGMEAEVEGILKVSPENRIFLERSAKG